MNRDKNGRFAPNTISYMFKVVRKFYITESYASARCGDLQYNVGQITKPTIPNSKIFVFKNYSDAKKFAYESERIFLCEVTNVIRLKTYAYYDYEIKDFWSGKLMITWKNYEVPQGTYGCDSCKLLLDVTDGLK